MYFHYKVIFGTGVITIKFTLQTILFFYLSIFFINIYNFYFHLLVLENIRRNLIFSFTRCDFHEHKTKIIYFITLQT
jgi:hypothetical protein